MLPNEERCKKLQIEIEDYSCIFRLATSKVVKCRKTNVMYYSNAIQRACLNAEHELINVWKEISRKVAIYFRHVD